jgi:HEAT repeat protein
MNFNEKCDYLFRVIDYPSETNFESIETQLESLSHDRSPFIRSLVARALFDYQTDFSKAVLLKLTSDKDDLVRTEAVDSLRAFADYSVYFRLLHIAEFDRYYLTRAYTIYSLAIIGAKLSSSGLRDFILNRLNNERFIINKIMCLQSLYIIGQEESLYKLISYFGSKNYRNKCAVVNALTEVLSSKNYSIIKEFVDSVSLKNLPASVSSSLKDLQFGLRNFLVDDYVK